jgi:hypothetical protein
MVPTILFGSWLLLDIKQWCAYFYMITTLDMQADGTELACRHDSLGTTCFQHQDSCTGTHLCSIRYEHIDNCRNRWRGMTFWRSLYEQTWCNSHGHQFCTHTHQEGRGRGERDVLLVTMSRNSCCSIRHLPWNNNLQAYGIRICEMSVLLPQPLQSNELLSRLAMAIRPQRSQMCVRYASD